MKKWKIQTRGLTETQVGVCAERYEIFNNALSFFGEDGQKVFSIKSENWISVSEDPKEKFPIQEGDGSESPYTQVVTFEVSADVFETGQCVRVFGYHGGINVRITKAEKKF